MQQRWRNAISPFIAYLNELWTVIQDALSNFVWSDLRSGLIDLRGLSLPVRFIIWLGFALTATCLFLLTQAPAIRAIFPFHTSVTPAPGRGLHIPLILFPLSLFLLSLAWAYLITGARNSHALIRWGVFLLYTSSATGWLIPLLVTNPSSVAVGGAFFAVVLLAYLWPTANQLHPTALFMFVLLSVGGLFATAQFPLIGQDQASGLPIGKTILEGNLRSLVTLAIPLLMLIGLDIADFTVHTSIWLQEAASRLLPNRLLQVLTVIVLAWLLWQGITYVAVHQATVGTFAILTQLAGAFMLVLLLWLTWAILGRLSPTVSTITLDHFTQAASRVAIVLVVAFLLPLLISFLFTEVAQVVQSLAVELQTGIYGDYPKFVTWAATLYALANSFSTLVLQSLFFWQRICACFAVGAAIILYRGNQRAGAFYAITVGVNYLWVELTRPDQWLQALNWTTLEPVVFSWAILLVIWSLVLIWRRKFNARLHNLLILTLLLVLLRQTNLIAAPLDPLFSLAGVGYLAVGIGWDLLTAGNWANATSASLPRTSRIFLYLGYTILTVMLINWAVSAHDFPLLDRFTGEAALTGLSLLGYPYLFSVFYLVLTNTLVPSDNESSTVRNAQEPSSSG